MTTIPQKFKCSECEGEGTLWLCGNAGGSWYVECPACYGNGLNDDGEAHKAAQDKIALEEKALKDKYEKAMAETRQRREGANA